MPPNCPSCRSSRTRVTKTSVLLNGSRRRRHRCHVCSYRWSTWCGEKPRIGRAPHAKTGSRTRPPLTEDEVRLALTSPLSAMKLARELQCSKEAIAAIRRGTTHAKVLPELPRRQPLSCVSCINWKDASCAMGFPEVLEEGPVFAADCSLYEARSQT
jgi:hypothetical protein